MSRKQMTFYHSYWDAIKKLRRKDDRLSILEAIVAYALDGEELPLTENTESIFALVKPTLDAAARKSDAGKLGGSKPKANDKQTESKEEANRKQTANEKENENEIEVEKERENECSLPQKSPSRKKRGEFGWVLLTDDEYDRLVADLGAAETERCIRYIDEAAQSSGNKNRWKDWNLVIRRCSREGWGLKAGSAKVYSSYTHSDPPDAESYARMEKLLAKMGGGK